MSDASPAPTPARTGPGKTKATLARLLKDQRRGKTTARRPAPAPSAALSAESNDIARASLEFFSALDRLEAMMEWFHRLPDKEQRAVYDQFQRRQVFSRVQKLGTHLQGEHLALLVRAMARQWAPAHLTTPRDDVSEA